MTRLYSSFDLDQILADDLAKRERERQEQESRARAERIGALRAKNKDDPQDASDGVPVMLSPQALDHSSLPQALAYSRFTVGEDDQHYFLSNLPIGTKYADVFLTKKLLYDGNAFSQVEWRNRLRPSQDGHLHRDLLSGPEFEAIVRGVAMHSRSDDLKVFESLKASVREDLASKRMTRSGIQFVPVGADGVSHSYFSVIAHDHGLKGGSCSIDYRSDLHTELNDLLETSPVSYCAARSILGIDFGVFVRWQVGRIGHNSPLIVGANLLVNVDEPAPARGAFVRYLPIHGGGV